MGDVLRGKRIAALVDDGFEQVELTEPREALEAAGAQVDVISPQSGTVKGWQHAKWGDQIPVDRILPEARPDEYDALLLPGGVMSPDKLRMNPQAVQFVKAFAESGKPIAAICHGPWTLIEAGAVKGRTLTSWPSLKTDLRNAGATWVDQSVIVDHGLVTSRKPDDIPVFNKKMIEEFAEGRHTPYGRSRDASGTSRPRALSHQ
jgi:protease I